MEKLGVDQTNLGPEDLQTAMTLGEATVENVDTRLKVSRIGERRAAPAAAHLREQMRLGKNLDNGMFSEFTTYHPGAGGHSL